MGFGKALLLLVLGAGGALAAWSAHKDGMIPWTRPVVAVQATRAVTRTKAESKARPLRTVLQSDGYVSARRRAAVGSARPGKIAAIYVEEGDAVVTSQVIAKLEDA